MATQPWWSVRLAQWRATWEAQRYSHRNTLKKLKYNVSYRGAYSSKLYNLSQFRPRLWLVLLLCLITGTAVSFAVWQASHGPLNQTMGNQTGSTGTTTANTASQPTKITTPTNNSAPKSPEESYTIAKNGQLAVYWVLNEGKKFKAIPVAIATPSIDQSKANPSQDLDRYALKQLLNQQPPTQKLKNTIPKGTKLLEWRREVTPDGSQIWLNLSSEFTQGGGAASMQGRLVQLIYTATITAPDAAVYINVAGEPLTVLGGEGLVISQPTRRQDLSLQF